MPLGPCPIGRTTPLAHPLPTARLRRTYFVPVVNSINCQPEITLLSSKHTTCTLRFFILCLSPFLPTSPHRCALEQRLIPPHLAVEIARKSNPFLRGQAPGIHAWLQRLHWYRHSPSRRKPVPHRARKRTKFAGLACCTATYKAPAASAADASTLGFDDGLEEDTFIERVGLDPGAVAPLSRKAHHQDARESPPHPPSCPFPILCPHSHSPYSSLSSEMAFPESLL